MTAARSADPLDRILARDEVTFDDEPRQLPLARSRRRRILDAITWPARAPFGWWIELTPPERLMYRGLALLAVGLALTPWPQLALIVPGAVLTAAAFGFSLRRVEVNDG